MKMFKCKSQCRASAHCVKRFYGFYSSFKAILLQCLKMQVPVAERSKAWVCSPSPAGIAGSNPAGDMDVCVVCVVQLGQKAKPGHSGQRSTVKIQRTKKNPLGVWMVGCPL